MRSAYGEATPWCDVHRSEGHPPLAPPTHHPQPDGEDSGDSTEIKYSEAVPSTSTADTPCPSGTPNPQYESGSSECRPGTSRSDSRPRDRKMLLTFKLNAKAANRLKRIANVQPATLKRLGINVLHVPGGVLSITELLAKRQAEEEAAMQRRIEQQMPVQNSDRLMPNGEPMRGPPSSGPTPQGTPHYQPPQAMPPDSAVPPHMQRAPQNSSSPLLVGLLSNQQPPPSAGPTGGRPFSPYAYPPGAAPPGPPMDPQQMAVYQQQMQQQEAARRQQMYLAQQGGQPGTPVPPVTPTTPGGAPPPYYAQQAPPTPGGAPVQAVPMRQVYAPGQVGQPMFAAGGQPAMGGYAAGRMPAGYRGQSMDETAIQPPPAKKRKKPTKKQQKEAEAAAQHNAAYFPHHIQPGGMQMMPAGYSGAPQAGMNPAGFPQGQPPPGQPPYYPPQHQQQMWHQQQMQQRMMYQQQQQQQGGQVWQGQPRGPPVPYPQGQNPQQPMDPSGMASARTSGEFSDTASPITPHYPQQGAIIQQPPLYRRDSQGVFSYPSTSQPPHDHDQLDKLFNDCGAGDLGDLDDIEPMGDLGHAASSLLGEVPPEVARTPTAHTPNTPSRHSGHTTPNGDHIDSSIASVVDMVKSSAASSFQQSAPTQQMAPSTHRQRRPTNAQIAHQMVNEHESSSMPPPSHHGPPPSDSIPFDANIRTTQYHPGAQRTPASRRVEPENGSRQINGHDTVPNGARRASTTITGSGSNEEATINNLIETIKRQGEASEQRAKAQNAQQKTRAPSRKNRRRAEIKEEQKHEDDPSYFPMTDMDGRRPSGGMAPPPPQHVYSRQYIKHEPQPKPS